MKSNIGTTDKTIRVILAVLAAVLYFTGLVKGVLGIIILIIAVLLLLTSLISFCPLYFPFGWNTGGKKADKE
jgi:multisubunit Na+/H+ antiporter MnhG subunit